MPSTPEIVTIIAEATGAAVGTVRQLARCLGEAGMLGVRIRGRGHAKLEPIHVARMIAGLMALAGGIGITMPEVPDVVRRIEKISSAGLPFSVFAEDDRLVARPDGSVIQFIEFLLSIPPETLLRDLIKGIDTIGLTFGRADVYGWMKDTQATLANAESGGNIIIFGVTGDMLDSGLKRHVEIGIDDIEMIRASILPEGDRPNWLITDLDDVLNVQLPLDFRKESSPPDEAGGPLDDILPLGAS